MRELVTEAVGSQQKRLDPLFAVCPFLITLLEDNVISSGSTKFAHWERSPPLRGILALAVAKRGLLEGLYPLLILMRSTQI